MAVTVTPEMRTQVSQLYVALFGRAPDSEGLGYWAQQVANGASIATVADAMYGTTPARTYYPLYLTPEEIVTKFYQNVLGRNPDTDGKTYWTGELQKTDATPGSVIAKMISVVANYDTTQTSTDPVVQAGIASAKLFNNKVAVAEYFATKVGTVAGSTDVLATVTADPATVTAAKAVVDGVGVPGQTFTLTTSATDIVNGTAGNDTIIGDFTTSTTGGTIQPSDTINGGAGIDTFKIFGYNGTSVINSALPVTVNGVEIFDIVRPTDGAVNVSAYAIDKLIVEQAQLLNAKTITTQATTALQLDTVGAAAGKITWDNGTAATANLTLNGFTGTSSAAAAGDLDLNGAAVATLNIVSQGVANTTTIGNTGGALKTINITGSAALKLGSVAAGVTTIDGNAATGALTFTADAAATTIKTGSAADKVDIAAVTGPLAANFGAGNDTVVIGANLTIGAIAGTSIDGGSGTNTLNVTDGSTFTTANLAGVSNFTVLDVAGSTNGAAKTYDVTKGTAFTTFQADHSINAASTTAHLSNVASGFTFTVKSAASTNQTDTAYTFVLKTDDATATAADTLNFNLVSVDGDNDATAEGLNTVTTLTATGFEVINLGGSATKDTGVAGSKYVQTITTLTDANLKTLNISGDEQFVITNALTNVTKVDASSNTGGVTVSAAGVTNAVNMIGGSGADTFTAGAGGTTIYGGAGNDTFNLKAGVADIIVYKAAGDVTNNVTAAGKIDVGSGKIETITGFGTTATAGATAHDTIDLSNIGGFSGYAKGVAAVTFTSAAAIGSSVSNLFVDAGGQRGAAAYSDGTGTYLFVDANHDGNFTAATDMVIKLAGVTNLTATDINFG